MRLYHGSTIVFILRIFNYLHSISDNFLLTQQIEKFFFSFFDYAPLLGCVTMRRELMPGRFLIPRFAWYVGIGELVFVFGEEVLPVVGRVAQTTEGTLLSIGQEMLLTHHLLHPDPLVLVSEAEVLVCLRLQLAYR